MKKGDKPKKAHGLTPCANGDVTDSGPSSAGVNGKRRILLKKTGAATAVLTTWMLPKKWQKPAIDVVGLPVHAQTSPSPFRDLVTTTDDVVRVTKYEFTENGVRHNITLNKTAVAAISFKFEISFNGRVIAASTFTFDQLLREYNIRFTVSFTETGTYTSVLSSDDVVVPADVATQTIIITVP